jgi:succinate dehydrogenase/fumarate reductase cytochrome b subunit
VVLVLAYLGALVLAMIGGLIGIRMVQALGNPYSLSEAQRRRSVRFALELLFVMALLGLLIGWLVSGRPS